MEINLDRFTEKRVEEIINKGHDKILFKEILLEMATKYGYALGEGCHPTIAAKGIKEHFRSVGEVMITLSESFTVEEIVAWKKGK